MDLKIDKKITLIKKRLNQSLPGWDSQKKMAVMPISPVTQLAFIPPADAKLAAVAIILFQEDNKLKFFLTRRTSNVDHHKGQISLPGGAKDEGESFEDASLRESEEEIGVNVDLDLLGELTPLYAPVSGFLIHSYIWYVKERPNTIINEDEVESIHDVDLDELQDTNVLSTKSVNVKGLNIKVPSFKFDSCTSWGATAMILSELKDLLAEI
ncbi:MAG: CoA pyrophosphatase [Candidatus Marinimicrobia bacterium]|jgi:8-oxo-dGTP pyrophosphatase MutT (NUDIX family)|nr:CoA pyrophosphatase [Candidatus Neomarinimicrobiota bacterium]